MANDTYNWTRRRFVLSLGAAAITAGCESKRRASEARRFPSTFRWGCGSSAFQVEGALDVDGRGESIWDVFAKQNGRIKDGSTPSITCNSYYRYKEDAALITAANLNSYKFSISWQMLADVVKTGDMSTIHQGCDFIGVNYYSPVYLKADFSGPSFLAPGRTPAGVTQDASGPEIDPSGLQEVL